MSDIVKRAHKILAEQTKFRQSKNTSYLDARMARIIRDLIKEIEQKPNV